MKFARITDEGASKALAALIDSAVEGERFSPDGIDCRTAWRVTWQTTARVEDDDKAAPETPWMRMSEEEKSRIRSRRRLRAVSSSQPYPPGSPSTSHRRAA